VFAGRVKVNQVSEYSRTVFTIALSLAIALLIVLGAASRALSASTNAFCPLGPSPGKGETDGKRGTGDLGL